MCVGQKHGSRNISRCCLKVEQLAKPQCDGDSGSDPRCIIILVFQKCSADALTWWTKAPDAAVGVEDQRCC